MSNITKYLYQHGHLAEDSLHEYDTLGEAIEAARATGNPYAIVERTYSWDDDVILFSSPDEWPPSPCEHIDQYVNHRCLFVCRDCNEELGR